MSKTKPDQLTNPANPPRTVQLAQRILALHESDIDCEGCCDQLDCLAELIADGFDTRDLLPAVQLHLECCPDCYEEFEALLIILRAEQAGKC